MSRISEKFDELKNTKGKALITFIEAGDPDLTTTEKLVYEMEKQGADIVELGVPFSDSIADGPIIQAAGHRALKKGATPEKIIKLVGKIREKSPVPIALMISYNLINKYGIEKFIEDCASEGVDGIISPDIPPEEAGELRERAKKCKIDTIFLAAPSSTHQRTNLISQASSGFIYLISLLGITGVRKEISSTVQASIEQIRNYTDKPIAVGFGISTPEQAKMAVRYAEGVIVGSAIVDTIDKNRGKTDMVKRVGIFVSRLKSAIGNKGR